MNTTSKLISAFVLLILGAALIGTLATSTQDVTTIKTATDSFTLVKVGAAVNNTYPYYLSGFGGWKEDVSECSAGTLIVSGSKVVAKNSTGATLTMNGCDAGDYYFIEGINEINFCNNANINKTSAVTVTHKYCPNEYQTNGWGRTGLNVTIGLFAIAILLSAIGFFYSVAKDTGILS